MSAILSSFDLWNGNSNGNGNGNGDGDGDKVGFSLSIFVYSIDNNNNITSLFYIIILELVNNILFYLYLKIII